MPTKPYGKMICPLCKKPFVCHYTSTWAYRKNFNYEVLVFCSYGCKAKHDKLVADGTIKKISRKDRKKVKDS